MNHQPPPTPGLFADDDHPLAQVPVSGAPKPSSISLTSPRWGATTKLVIGLALVSVCAFLLFRFLNIVGPLLLAFILAYLFYPIAEELRHGVNLSWRASVTFAYVILLILIVGSLAIGGLAVIEQVQSLIAFLQRAVNDLPVFFNNLTSHPLQIGPFVFNAQLIDINALSQQILGAVQPILSQAGTSVLSVATGAATVIGWLFFILLVSYFILAESGGFPNRLINFNIPGYDEDVQQLGHQLNRIWNAFLRGQITIVLLTIFIYNILLGGLGIHFFFGLALLAGLARFVPYVGPLVAWTSYGLVAFFQGSTIFGLQPLGYVALVVGVAWSTDFVMDNVVVPRLMSSALKVHPAAVMVSALVAFNLLGIIGVILAAPVLATLKLFLEYIVAKLMDQDPWAGMETTPPFVGVGGLLPRAQVAFDKLRARLIKTQPPPEK